MNIGDLFYLFRGDGSQLLLDAQKSGSAAADAAGKAFGARYGGAISTASKAGFAVLAAGSAIAGKGLLELNSIQADFQAETGASAEEADRAGKAINAMGGRNLQPLKEIGAALTKVHTDLGLTGDQAEQTTESFLKYATATKQDAAGAVVAFDDILDNWGLTAADATTIMDKLIVSHQKFGGVITDNQTTLATLAPALRAANFQIDDGIALLGLFGAKGLNAEAASAAFAKALTKVKSPAELQALITDISNTTDPFQRAAKAADLFGAKAGAKLANALGGVDLKDYTIGVNEAAGATEKASGIIENSFPNWIKLRVKELGAAVIGLGQDFGPVATGAAGLLSIVGALGPKLGGALAGAWKIAAGSSLLAPAIKAASSKVETLLLKGMFAQDAVEGAVKGLWGRIAATSAGQAFIAGTASGTVFRTAASAAIVGLVAVVAVKLIFDYVDAQKQNVDLINKIGDDAAHASLEQLQGFRDQLATALAAEKDRFDPIEDFFGLSQQNNLQRQLDAIDSMISGSMALTADHATKSLVRNLDVGGSFVRGVAGRFGSDLAAAMAPAITLGVKTAFGSDLAARSSVAIAYTRRIGNLAGAGVAQGILDKRNAVDQAWQSLLDAIKNSQSVTQQNARLTGELASKALIKGLHDPDPAVRAQARYTKQLIIDQLNELKPRAGTLSKEAMENLRKAMHSKDSDIRKAATAIYTAAISGPKKLPADGTKYGGGLVANVAAGMNAGLHLISEAGSRIAREAQRYLRLSSPAEKGPWSTLGGPEGWGRRFTMFVARGMVRGEGDIASASYRLAGRAARPLGIPAGGSSLPPLQWAPSGHIAGVPESAGTASGVTYNYTQDVRIEGAPKARDPLGVAVALGRFARNRLLEDVWGTPAPGRLGAGT